MPWFYVCIRVVSKITFGMGFLLFDILCLSGTSFMGMTGGMDAAPTRIVAQEWFSGWVTERVTGRGVGVEFIPPHPLKPRHATHPVIGNDSDPT